MKLSSATLAIIITVSCLFAVYSLGAASERGSAKPGQIRIVTVVKRTGIVWFERMEQGIKQFAAQNGIDATMTGAG